jgi:hypothetical protein
MMYHSIAEKLEFQGVHPFLRRAVRIYIQSLRLLRNAQVPRRVHTSPLINTATGQLNRVFTANRKNTITCPTNVYYTQCRKEIIHQWLYIPLLRLGLLFRFVILYTVDSTLRTEGGQPVARPLPTHRTIQTQNKRTYKHPCLQWNSNRRPQCSSGRRKFVHYTMRAL